MPDEDELSARIGALSDLCGSLEKYANTLATRVEQLQSELLRHQAMFSGVLLCLRDAAKLPPDYLEKAFRHYSAQTHQVILEKVEDVDPWLAARLDQRTDEFEGL